MLWNGSNSKQDQIFLARISLLFTLIPIFEKLYLSLRKIYLTSYILGKGPVSTIYVNPYIWEIIFYLWERYILLHIF